jgi:hypothetical protein
MELGVGIFSRMGTPFVMFLICLRTGQEWWLTLCKEVAQEAGTVLCKTTIMSLLRSRRFDLVLGNGSICILELLACLNPCAVPMHI